MKIEDFISMESNRPNHLMLSVLTCICCEDIFSWYCAVKWTQPAQSTVNSQQGDVNQHWAWSPGADICIGLCCPPIFRELEGVAVCYKARWYDLPLNIMSHVTPQQYSLLQTFYILQGNRGDKLSGVEWKSSKLECARSRSGNAYLCEIWFQR